MQGKQLSYNNINDTDAAYECIGEFDAARTAACVIVKHANPCGVAEADDLVERLSQGARLRSDVGVRRHHRHQPAARRGDRARDHRDLHRSDHRARTPSEEAIAIIGAKKNLRLLLAGGLPDPRAPGLTFKTVAGGMLVQTRDNAVVDDDEPEDRDAARSRARHELRDLKFAFRVAKHVKSNTIVYAKDLATVGIGAGQMSRVDSARIAADKAEDAAQRSGLPAPMTTGSVVASDAFFPFADGLLAAIEAGATAVIQPGGSMRDDEVIEAADAHGIAMVFTGDAAFPALIIAAKRMRELQPASRRAHSEAQIAVIGQR